MHIDCGINKIKYPIINAFEVYSSLFMKKKERAHCIYKTEMAQSLKFIPSSALLVLKTYYWSINIT